VLPFGVRVALPGPNIVVDNASLELPAALAFLTLIAASGSFVTLILRMRREFAGV